MNFHLDNRINDSSVNKKAREFCRLPDILEISALLLLILLCSILVGFFSHSLTTSDGTSIMTLLRDMNFEQIKTNRGLVRIALLLSNLSMFLIPGILCSFMLYKKYAFHSVKADVFPAPLSSVLGVLSIIMALPFVAYSFIINQKIPLPEWMVDLEKNNNELISSILMMESPLELLACVIVVALVPAIGEEWVFRGILQHRLQEGWLKKFPHVAIWLTAIIFSAVHGQFQGFLPRMFLGALLGYMFFWSGSLWLSILGHFVNNAFQVVGYYFLSDSVEQLDISQAPEILWWQGLFSLLVVVVLMFGLKKVSSADSDTNDKLTKHE